MAGTNGKQKDEKTQEAKVKATVPGIIKMKEEGRKVRVVTAYDYPTAALVDQVDIDIVLVGDTLGMVVLGYDSTVPVTMEDMIHHTRAVVRGAPNTLVVTDLPFMSYQISRDEALRNAGRAMKEGGADAVKVEGGETVAETIKAMANAGIPVMGHLGLTPQSVAKLGGYRVQGRDAESARKIVEDARALEKAGCFSLVLECVPTPVAQRVSQEIKIPTIGIGAGPHCDGQVLVIHDLLGLFERFTPKFVKRYANLAADIRQALEQYATEVAEGVFPGPEHSFNMKEDELQRFYGGSGRIGFGSQ